MKKHLRVLQKIENTVIIVAFIIMTAASFAQVVNRNLIGAPVSWFEELARYCMVYMALLATEIGLRDGTQIAITAIVDHFTGVPRKLIDIFGKAVVSAFSATVFITSFTLLNKQIATGQTTAGLRIPMAIPFFALPLAFGIITIVQLAGLYLSIRDAGTQRDNGETVEGGAQ